MYLYAIYVIINNFSFYTYIWKKKKKKLVKLDWFVDNKIDTNDHFAFDAILNMF